MPHVFCFTNTDDGQKTPSAGVRATTARTDRGLPTTRGTSRAKWETLSRRCLSAGVASRDRWPADGTSCARSWKAGALRCDAVVVVVVVVAVVVVGVGVGVGVYF